MASIPEYVDGLPNISGSEDQVAAAVERGRGKTLYRGAGHIDFGTIRSATAIALHMHQPLIPAGGYDLRTATIIGKLPGSRSDHVAATVGPGRLPAPARRRSGRHTPGTPGPRGGRLAAGSRRRDAARPIGRAECAPYWLRLAH